MADRLHPVVAGLIARMTEKMKTLPDGQAEAVDYEFWAKDFVKLLVSVRRCAGQ